MAFAHAIFDGRTTLDGVGAIRVDDPDAVPGMHRIRFAAPHARALTACLLLVGLLVPPSCWAYRPFISTDAAVADPQEVAVELGYFTLERDKGENSFIIPRVVLNYGLFRNSPCRTCLGAETYGAPTSTSRSRRARPSFQARGPMARAIILPSRPMRTTVGVAVTR